MFDLPTEPRTSQEEVASIIEAANKVLARAEAVLLRSEKYLEVVGS